MSDVPASRPGSPVTLKVPPHSTEAEQSVLGGLMLNNEAWYDVAEILSARDFYRPQHQIVFEAMQTLMSGLKPLDAITISDAIGSRGLLDKVGGMAYLADLVESTPGISNVVAYARIVRDRSVLRQLIATLHKYSDAAFSPEGKSGQEIVDLAEQAVFKISEGLASDGDEGLPPLLDRTLRRIRELSESPGSLTGLATGFADLDEMTAGLQKGDLIVVAGRPSMGKTAFALNIVEHALLQSQAPTLLFSLEMSTEQLAMRMISSLGRIDHSHVRSGQLSQSEWPKLTGVLTQLRVQPLDIQNVPSLTPSQLRARARRFARANGGIGLIVVDYLQLMSGSGQAENRTNEISEISRSLKALATEMRCPVIAVSQLNRALESRNNKRPVMADLRESGAIEQDADVILFIYRDEVYSEDSDDTGIAEIIIGKQRNGPIGTVKLSFLNHLTRFEDLAPSRYDASSR